MIAVVNFTRKVSSYKALQVLNDVFSYTYFQFIWSKISWKWHRTIFSSGGVVYRNILRESKFLSVPHSLSWLIFTVICGIFLFLQKATKGLVTLNIKVISLYALNTKWAERKKWNIFTVHEMLYKILNLLDKNISMAVWNPRHQQEAYKFVLP